MVDALVKEGVDSIQALLGGALFDVRRSLFVEYKRDNQRVSAIRIVGPE